jgi:lysozyme
MQYSDNGYTLTESFEGLRLTAYKDSVGVLTIGYGHTGPDVTVGLTITKDRAIELLHQDIQKAVDCVNKLVTVTISQNQFDALVDFVFNLGCQSLAGSHLLLYVNSSQFDKAANQFVLWDHAGGQVEKGLWLRRIAEAKLFRS